MTTAGSEAEAETIASALIEERLAACVNVMPVRSVYTWQGKVHHDAEWQLVIKTRADRFDSLSNRVRELHSYDTPELIALPIEQGSADYLAWLNDQVD